MLSASNFENKQTALNVLKRRAKILEYGEITKGGKIKFTVNRSNILK